MKSRIVILSFILLVAAASLLLDSCRKLDIPDPSPIGFSVPEGFPQPAYNFSANPLTEEGFRLGKRLFFDHHLSVDGHISCGSCHQPLAAFTTFEHDRSHGVNNTHTLRNAPGIFNMAWYREFNQDGSANSLHQVYREHFTSPTAMGETMSRIIEKLRHEEYRILFRDAFGDGRVTEERIYKALDQYVLSLVSANTKYDKVKRGETSFTTQEAAGYAVFQAKCATCHKEPFFTDFSYRNTGLDVDPQLADFGRMRVTGNQSDSLKFRVPSLRNAEFTSYYGHDGRMSFFRRMLQHYRFGVKGSPTLDPLLTNGIQLTNEEEDQIVAFIRTLSDTEFLNNPRFRE
ncbi:MAG: cytochrome-c peroxidase [Bacteroidota bacterium]|nr:cytochrome-c peroxidase [Bacteroidota bacterium]